jgi:hypothetical protein
VGKVAREVSEFWKKPNQAKYTNEKKMSAKSTKAAVQAAPAQPTSEEIRAEDLFIYRKNKKSFSLVLAHQ